MIAEVVRGEEAAALVGGEAVIVGGDEAGCCQCRIVNYHTFMIICSLLIYTCMQYQLHQPHYTCSTHKAFKDLASLVTNACKLGGHHGHHSTFGYNVSILSEPSTNARSLQDHLC